MFPRTNLALAILWAGSSLLVGAQDSEPLNIGSLLQEISDYVRELQNKTHNLLETYLVDQGRPFNGSDFSAEQLRLTGLPQASIPYLAWRRLSDSERLRRSHAAYSAFLEFFQLTEDDQAELHPDRQGLRAALGRIRADLRHLQSRLGAALAALGQALPPPAEDPLGLRDEGAGAFGRQLRGYLVCREYRLWLVRTGRSLALLASKYRAS